jgi:hypothetical protein
MKPDVIVAGKLYARTQERMEKEFTCHKLYEAADRAAFLKEFSSMRALATFGPNGADAKLMGGGEPGAGRSHSGSGTGRAGAGAHVGIPYDPGNRRTLP